MATILLIGAPGTSSPHSFPVWLIPVIAVILIIIIVVAITRGRR